MGTGEIEGLAIKSYCVGCGRGLIASAVMCPGCGTPVSGSAAQARRKDKTVSVILAVFLSGWTWLYTYSKDSAKFWIYLGVGLAISLILAVSFIVSLDSYEPESVLTGPLVLAYLNGFAFWLWAVIDAARKPREWYESYA